MDDNNDINIDIETYKIREIIPQLKSFASGDYNIKELQPETKKTITTILETPRTRNILESPRNKNDLESNRSKPDLLNNILVNSRKNNPDSVEPTPRNRNDSINIIDLQEQINLLSRNLNRSREHEKNWKEQGLKYEAELAMFRSDVPKLTREIADLELKNSQLEQINNVQSSQINKMQEQLQLSNEKVSISTQKYNLLQIRMEKELKVLSDKEEELLQANKKIEELEVQITNLLLRESIDLAYRSPAQLIVPSDEMPYLNINNAKQISSFVSPINDSSRNESPIYRIRKPPAFTPPSSLYSSRK